MSHFIASFHPVTFVILAGLIGCAVGYGLGYAAFRVHCWFRHWFRVIREARRIVQLKEMSK